MDFWFENEQDFDGQIKTQLIMLDGVVEMVTHNKAVIRVYDSTRQFQVDRHTVKIFNQSIDMDKLPLFLHLDDVVRFRIRIKNKEWQVTNVIEIRHTAACFIKKLDGDGFFSRLNDACEKRDQAFASDSDSSQSHEFSQ